MMSRRVTATIISRREKAWSVERGAWSVAVGPLFRPFRAEINSASEPRAKPEQHVHSFPSRTARESLVLGYYLVTLSGFDLSRIGIVEEANEGEWE